MVVTFADYQAPYENSFLPAAAQEKFGDLKRKFHYAAVVVDSYYSGPDLVYKVLQIATAFFPLFPALESTFKWPQQFCKDMKIVTGLMRGFRSIDGLLNPSFAWRSLVLDLAGATLFAISILSCIERIGIFQITAIKVMFSAIPVLGVLPYGGLLVLAVGTLSGSLLHYSFEKKEKLDFEEHRLIHQEIPLWSKPLDLSQVKANQAKYQNKVQDFTSQVRTDRAILQEGRKVTAELLRQTPQEKKKIYASRKAIQTLTNSIAVQTIALKKYEKKRKEWDLLAKQWSSIDPNELEDYCEAKRAKCRDKLDRIDYEKKLNFLSLVSNTVLLSRQILTLAALFSRTFLIPLPFQILLDLTVTSSGLITYGMRRVCAGNKKIQPVALTDHVHLYPASTLSG